MKRDDKTMDYQISKIEIDRLFSTVQEATVIRTLSALDVIPDRVSQNKAAKIVGGKAKLANFIKEGRIKPYSKGNGKTGTVLFDYAKLIELKNSSEIIIHKPYYMSKMECEVIEKILEENIFEEEDV